MKKIMRKYLFVGLICGIIIFNLTGCATVDRYTMTSNKDTSKIIGSYGLILLKINGKPGPLNNFRGFSFDPPGIEAYNRQFRTFEVDLEPGEYTLEFDFYESYGSATKRAKDFQVTTLTVDRGKRYYLAYRTITSSEEQKRPPLDWRKRPHGKWQVYVSRVE